MLVNTRTAALRDSRLIAHLQRRFSDEVGHIPFPTVLERIEQGGVIIANVNDLAAGFLLTYKHKRPSSKWLPIYQAAIDFDAQRHHAGLALIASLERHEWNTHTLGLQCWCRSTMQANHFWRAAGFTPTAAHSGGSKRVTPVILWRKPNAWRLHDPAILDVATPRNGSHRTADWRFRKLDDADKLAIITASPANLLDILIRQT